MKRTLLLLMAALFALALFAPAAMAQDDNADNAADDGGGSAIPSASASASASASSTATATADDDGDDNVAALPETGGPALLAPIAGALLMAGGAASVLALRRDR
jgi:hypothetical protein